MSTTQWQKSLEIPGRVLFCEGNGDLPKLEVQTPWSNAEIYLHGAHITHFQKKNEPPLLFMSQLSRFERGLPIRGGIPVIFPWFGPREGQGAHGFARIQEWDLREVVQVAGGEVALRFCLPDSPDAALVSPFTADLWVNVGQTLAVRLVVKNTSSDQDFMFEGCLHTYFHIGDIGEISITGLKGVDYLDQTENSARKQEREDEIRITQETDRIYLGTAAPVEIRDTRLGRRIRIQTAGSLSTVVWNPWIKKSQQMPDFGDEEFHQMVCVESGNVKDNKITLPPDKSCELKAEYNTLPL